VVVKFIDYCGNSCDEACNSCHHVAIIECLATSSTSLISDPVTNAKLQHIHACEMTEDIELITIDNIVAPVVVVKATQTQGLLYVAELPNSTEMNL